MFLCNLDAQWAEPVSLTFHSALRKLNTEPCIGAYHQISLHLAKQFQRRFLEIDQPYKNCLWQLCLLTDREKIGNLYRVPSIYVSYKILVHLAKQFQRRFLVMFVYGSKRNEQSLQRTFHRCFLSSFGSFGKAVSEEKIFRNRPIRNKNCLWWPYLLMNRDEISNIHRGPAINASYQVLVHLAKRFQRRRFLKIGQSETRMACGGHVWHWIIWLSRFREDFQKSTNQKQELPMAAMFVNGSGQNWQSLQGLKLAVAHSPFASKFQCGPLKISSQSSTWRVKIRKNKIV